MKNDTMKLLESIQNNLNEDINLPNNAESFTEFEKGKNYNPRTDACKINAFKAYSENDAEKIYGGKVVLEDGSYQPHFWNVINNKVIDHSNIFKVGTPKEYKGVCISDEMLSKGFTPIYKNEEAFGENSKGDKLDVTIGMNGIIYKEV